MATQAGLNRVAAINKTIATQGQAAPNPMGGQNYYGGSGGGSNPKDAPGYQAGSSSTDSKASQDALATSGVKPTPIPEQPIDTTQPSPQTAQIAPPNAAPTAPTMATPEQTAAVAQATQQVQNLSEQYKQRLATAKTVAPTAPSSQGQAQGIIQSTAPQAQEEAPSIIGDLMDYDSNFDSILTSFDEFMSPTTQKVSLMDEYNQLSKQLGIQSLNEQLINEKNIIDGTEDDIRNEITATGGMATDSQVLALANARNKSLIKNYNTLLDTKNNAEQQLTTMMNLSYQDRTMASAEFDRKLNFAFKVSEFKQKAVDNARSNYQSIVKDIGYSGLLAATNGNAYEQSIIEKTLGLGSGGLAKMAAVPKPGDLQFVAGTENQPSGVFDKNTGTFIPYGGYGGGTGTGAVNADAQSWVTNIQNKTATIGDVPAKLKTEVSNILASQPKQMGAVATNMTSIINGLVDNPNIKYATGLTGALPTFLTYGSEAFNIKKQADQVKNMLALENRQSLKGQGTISDFEGKMLANAATTLSSGLTPQAYEQELRKIRGFVQVMNGNPIEVKIVNPKTGEFQFTLVDEAGLEKAINDGAVIEYQ